MNIAFFDTKEYDKTAFASYDGKDGLNFRFYEARLCDDTAELARGFDAICAFVNDDINSSVIEKICSFGVKLIALRCSGYNNVDMHTACGKIAVARVPAYSPYTVAEHAMAMLLCSIRLIGEKAEKREVMGAGDVYVSGIIGLYLGIVKFLICGMTACIVAFIAIRILRKKKNYDKAHTYPFAPFFLIGYAVSILLGDMIFEKLILLIMG